MKWMRKRRGWRWQRSSTRRARLVGCQAAEREQSGPGQPQHLNPGAHRRRSACLGRKATYPGHAHQRGTHAGKDGLRRHARVRSSSANPHLHLTSTRHHRRRHPRGAHARGGPRRDWPERLRLGACGLRRLLVTREAVLGQEFGAEGCVEALYLRAEA